MLKSMSHMGFACFLFFVLKIKAGLNHEPKYIIKERAWRIKLKEVVYPKTACGIVDLRSERLFREAEDDFYYFGKPKLAQKKLYKALEFTPDFVKALIMLANIAFYNGKMADCLDLYRKAEVFEPENVKVLSGLANIFEVAGEYEKAYFYVDRALLSQRFISPELRKDLIELKSVVLMKMKRYSEAKKLLEAAKKFLPMEEVMSIQAENLFALNHKLKLQKKIRLMRLSLV